MLLLPKTDHIKLYVKDSLRNIYWGLYGDKIRNPSPPISLKKILFVCKGNICRSPFAERLAKKMIIDQKLKYISVDSAGFEADASNSPPKEAALSSLRFGISLDGHNPKVLDVTMVERSDMILLMEVVHKKILERSFLGWKYKLFLLPLFYKNSEINYNKYRQFNIPDPYGQPEEQFKDCYTQIELCLKSMFLYYQRLE